MNYQQQAGTMLKKANAQLMATARAVSPEKMKWSPLNTGRTVLNMLQECAQTPGLLATVLEHRDTKWFTPERAAEAEAEQARLLTVDDCFSLMERNTEELLSQIARFPQSELSTVVTVPFGAGGEWTLAEVMLGHYWNNTYHVGQIGYIQTLYGDMKNHLE